MDQMQQELVRQQLLNTYVESIFWTTAPAAMAAAGTAAGSALGATVPTRLVTGVRYSRGSSMMALQLTLANARNEQEYDTYFRSLEERFIAVGVQPQYKEQVTRRLLTGRHLMLWNELVTKASAAGKPVTYEGIRDEFINASFPNSNLHEQMIKSLTAAAEKMTTHMAEASSTPGGGENGVEGGENGVEGGENGAEGAADKAGSAQAGSRVRGGPRTTGLASIRVRAELLKENMQRVSSRTGKAMPSEELWIQWATSLMRPPVYEAWLALDPKPTLLNDLLTVLAEQIKDTPDADPAGVATTASLRPKRNRNNNSKKLVKRTAGSATSTNNDGTAGNDAGVASAVTTDPQQPNASANEAPTTIVN